MRARDEKSVFISPLGFACEQERRRNELARSHHGETRKKETTAPFLGIGTAAVAAQRCGVARFIGIELDTDYLAMARDRVAVSEDKTMAV